MRRWSFIFGCALASCAPGPQVLLGHLRGLEQLATRASLARKSGCVSSGAQSLRCEQLKGCLLHVQAAAHRCNCAVQAGTSNSDAEYSAAARGCASERTATEELCAAALSAQEVARGVR
jgi:hypothetical protein